LEVTEGPYAPSQSFSTLTRPCPDLVQEHSPLAADQGTPGSRIRPRTSPRSVPEASDSIPGVSDQLESPQARSRRSRVRLESPQVRSQGSRVRPESPRVRSQGSRVRLESPQVRSQGSRVRPRESSSSVSRVSNSTREASGSVSRVSDSMSPVLNSIRGPWEETLEAGAETLWGGEGTERGFCGSRRCFGGDRRGADRTGEVRRRSPRAPGAPGEVPDYPYATYANGHILPIPPGAFRWVGRSPRVAELGGGIFVYGVGGAPNP